LINSLFIPTAQQVVNPAFFVASTSAYGTPIHRRARDGAPKRFECGAKSPLCLARPGSKAGQGGKTRRQIPARRNVDFRPESTIIPPVDGNEFSRSAAREFRTTHWSVVLAAGRDSLPEARAALETLCRAYWYPLYAHVRRRGHDHHAAQDLTQGFFARLLEKQWLNSVAPQKGRFRSFLLAALDHFLANEWRNAQAAKRGGGQASVSLEETRLGEERFARERASAGVPEQAFDRNWATTVLDQALARLQQEFAGRGRAAHFEDWKVFLTREATTGDCEASARRLGMSPGAVTVAVHRLRERYGDLLREAVAQTVPASTDVEDELRYLFGLLNE
jgi:DNA-directed RNA polymerase specialized sigma24 family protein